MTLTDEGRRVAARPAFPVPPGVADTDGEGYALRPEMGDPGMTIHEHATLELMKALWAAHDDAGPGFDWEDFKVHCAMDSMQGADAYCNALGALEAGQ